MNDFDEEKKDIKETENFKRIREEIIPEFKNLFDEKVNKESFNVEIKRIYLPGGIEKSLALNVVPQSKCFFKCLEEISEGIKGKMNKKWIDHDFKIKAYPEKDYQYFALNIFRFISNIENDIIHAENENFYKEFKKVKIKNKKEEKITIKMKTIAVISDPYLAKHEPIEIKQGERLTDS